MKHRTPTEKPEVKFDLLFTITNNNPLFTRQLLEAFLMELRGLNNQLKPILDPADLMLLSRSYHTIHPSFKMLGLSALADQLDHFRRPEDDIHISGKANRPEEFALLTESINKVIEDVTAYLWKEE